MTKPFVLIVEDDPKLNEIISIVLQADFELEACTDGGAAMEQLKSITPDIVVLDLNLPGSSGKEILTYIRSEERLAKTRVILATADERQAETLTNNADIILLKPVSPGLLRDLTSRMSGIKQDTSPRS
jgi:DNA-binding response OmpR family regulator